MVEGREEGVVRVLHFLFAVFEVREGDASILKKANVQFRQFLPRHAL